MHEIGSVCPTRIREVSELSKEQCLQSRRSLFTNGAGDTYGAMVGTPRA
jgi:hypothetical protein